MANPTVELGTFLFFAIVPFSTLLFINKLTTMGIMGFILFLGCGLFSFLLLGGMALYMFSGYDVVVTKTVDAQSSNELQHNATGALVLNSTTTTPAHNEVTNIITDNQQALGWLFFSFMMILGLLYIKVIFTG